MPSTTPTAPAAADRLAAVVQEIVGSEWVPAAGPEWPVTLIQQAADRKLTVYPQPRNGRIVFALEVASVPDPYRERYAKYTPDLSGHETIDAWIADGDLDAVSDALTVVVRKLADQPLPAPVAPHPDPVGREMELLATSARELARLTAQFAAGLVRGEPVADKARSILHLAQRNEQTAVRVDELRGPARP
ncbi:hypothetical protein [Streptomyces niveus]|uniref:hypothetical protein n=1 Tax=Streptomyces niveus TaxID=193462 RepID=UPI0037B902C0